MHVLIIPSWYPESEHEAGGSFFREQALSLARYSRKIGIIFPRLQSPILVLRGHAKPMGYRNFNDCGVEYIERTTINFTPRFKRGLVSQWLFHGSSLFSKYVATHGRPDVIHAHSALNAGVLALHLSQRARIPYILTEHSSGFVRDLYSSFELKLAHNVYASASTRIAVSSHFANTLCEKFKRDFVVLPNIVDDRFFSVESKNVDATSEFTFINVSALIPIKRQDLLISAMDECKRRGHKEFRLTLVGDGPERSRLASMIRRLGLETQIQLIGSVTRDAMPRILAMHRCYVLSSDYETFGVSLAEAMATGLGCIATRCGGPEDILYRGRLGQLVERNDPVALAEAMISFRNTNFDPTKSSKQRDTAKAMFGAKFVSERLLELYSSVIKT